MRVTEPAPSEASTPVTRPVRVPWSPDSNRNGRFTSTFVPYRDTRASGESVNGNVSEIVPTDPDVSCEEIGVACSEIV